jgi:hypothetical protein
MSIFEIENPSLHTCAATFQTMTMLWGPADGRQREMTHSVDTLYAFTGDRWCVYNRVGSWFVFGGWVDEKTAMEAVATERNGVK